MTAPFPQRLAQWREAPRVGPLNDGPVAASYLNDRLSLDGRDPSTWGNIAAMFAGAPSDRERPVYGRVATRGDGSTRNRAGGDGWLAAAATLPVPDVAVPDAVPVEPYLTG